MSKVARIAGVRPPGVSLDGTGGGWIGSKLKQLRGVIPPSVKTPDGVRKVAGDGRKAWSPEIRSPLPK